MNEISSKLGWSYGCKAESCGGVEVNVHNVCACRIRRKCEQAKRCDMLFDGSGGQYGEDRLLRFLLKKRHAPQKYETRQAAIDKFEKLYFKKCRPVVVKIFGRPRQYF